MIAFEKIEYHLKYRLMNTRMRKRTVFAQHFRAIKYGLLPYDVLRAMISVPLTAVLKSMGFVLMKIIGQMWKRRRAFRKPWFLT